MTVQDIENALLAANFEENIPAHLSNWDGADPALVQDVTSWVCGLRDDFFGLVRDIADEEQISASMAIYYIEIKSHWIALNTRMNYQMVGTGAADVSVVLRGSGISTFLAALEPLIAQEDVEAITEFLSEPIDKKNWSGGESQERLAA